MRLRGYALVLAEAAAIIAWSTAYAEGPAEDPLKIAVSLIQLIANPTAFDGKRVLVKGYITLDFENQAIWLSELDARHVITLNSLWLDVDDNGPFYANRAKLHRRYGLVMGTFNAAQRGHLSLYAGGIENITRLEPN